MLARDAWSLFRAALFSLGALAWLAASARAEQPRVLFLMPPLDANVRAQLQDALYAQLALVDAELVLRDADETREPRALAQAEGARAVLWLDTSADGRWLLHVVDLAQDRSVVRRIDAREAQQSAAIEAVAVLAREASRGGPLLEEPEPAEATEPAQPAQPAESTEPAETTTSAAEPVAPGAAPHADEPPPTLRLGLLYSGVDFARETSFNHGVSLSGRLDWEAGVYLSLHAGWAALAKPPGDTLVVQRIPVGAAIGYRIRLAPALWADLELGVLLDFLERSTRSAMSDQADKLRVVLAVAPRLRGEYRPVQLLGFFAGFGLDGALTPLRYRARTPGQETLLSPNWIRPALEAGVAFYP